MSDERYIFGVDIGGTTVKLGLFTSEGRLTGSWEIPTRKEDNGSGILPDIAASVSERIEKEGIARQKLLGIGLGAPGPFDDEGVIHGAVNLGWGEFNVRSQLEDLTGLPVRAGNDANVAALGEYWMGAGQGAGEMLMVTLGTGVGGGIIHDGHIFNGSRGAGGEIGHIHMEDDEEEACGCGGHGCFEQYASATGAVRLARRILAESPDEGSVLRGRDIECRHIFGAAKEGDALAVRITKCYGEYLGKGLAIAAAVLNPEVIVIGGGVSKAGPMIIDLLTPAFMRYSFPGSRNVRFTLARLGNDAGIYGAARLMLP